MSSSFEIMVLLKSTYVNLTGSDFNW